MNESIRIGVLLLLTGLELVGCGPEQQVSFRQDVQPLLDAKCASCHTSGGAGYAASRLDMSSYQSLMKGTRFGPVVVPGDSAGSTLIRLVEGKADPSLRMPHGGDPLTPEEITTLKKWVDQGAASN